MTKICFSTPYAFGAYGDTTHIREVWEKVPVILNGQVYIYTSNSEDLGFKNINIVKLNTRIFGVRIRYLSKVISHFSVIWKALKLRGLSLVYERQSAMNISGLFISKLRGVPLIYEVNSLLEHERKPNAVNKIITIVSKITEKMTVKHASKIIVVTQGLKDIFIKEYSLPIDKVELIPNGANTKTFFPMQRAECQKALGIEEGKRVVCFVGGLGLGCGAKLLVECAPAIIQKVPDTRFLIVGDGPYKATMEQNIKAMNLEKRFIFAGAIPHGKIPKYINSSDVCVAMYSLDELAKKIGGSPIKLYEYMACAKPVVGTKGLVGLDILEKHDAGILIDQDSIEETSEKLIGLLLESDENLARMGKNGLRLVETIYNWELIAKQVSDVCAGVLAKNKVKSN